jgi:S1-C subfamily serine protease
MTNSPSPSSLSSLADAVERVAPAVLNVSTRRATGTGVSWREGIVVTSARLLWRSREVSLLAPDGEPLAAELAGLDPSTDLAVLRVTGTAVAPALLVAAGAPAPRVGDAVFAAARDPSGLMHASFGRLGAVGGAWRTWQGGAVDQLLRLDGGLYPGMEGAPVADAEGRVLGVASSAFSRHHGVVLPGSTVDRVVDELLAHGRVAQGYLGIAAQPAQARLGEERVDGLLLTSVADDGPAARAGLLVGDIIVRAGDEPATALDRLRARLQVGSSLPLTVVRGGQSLSLTLEVGERPEPPERAERQGWHGRGCRP